MKNIYLYFMFTIIICAIWWIGGISLYDSFISDKIVIEDIDQYEAYFKNTVSFSTSMLGIFYIIWFLYNEFWKKIKRYDDVSRIGLWLLLGFFLIICVIGCGFFNNLQYTEDGGIWVWTYFCSYLIAFYILTVFWSPSSVKYTVPGSPKIRKW